VQQKTEPWDNLWEKENLILSLNMKLKYVDNVVCISKEKPQKTPLKPWKYQVSILGTYFRKHGVNLKKLDRA